MTREAQIEEELVEAQAFYKLFVEEIGKVVADLRVNMEMDHKNDVIRTQATSHLVSALTAHSMRDYDDVNCHVNAALQRINSQEVLDLKDDKPRTDALVKLSVYVSKAQERIKRLRVLVENNKGGAST